MASPKVPGGRIQVTAVTALQWLAQNLINGLYGEDVCYEESCTHMQWHVMDVQRDISCRLMQWE